MQSVYNKVSTTVSILEPSWLPGQSTASSFKHGEGSVIVGNMQLMLLLISCKWNQAAEPEQ